MSSSSSSGGVTTTSLRERLRNLATGERLIRVACVLGLIALPLMVWSIFDPRVWPVLLALSVGQGIGTLSFLLFLIVVVRDLAVSRKLKDQPDITEP